MNRKVLFRAKTTPKDKGELNEVWVRGDLLMNGEKYYIHPQHNLVRMNGELGKIIVMHEVQPETICQYAGLKDKNGKKIFEGDIVEKEFYMINGVKYGRYSGTVKYEDCAWIIECKKQGHVFVFPIFVALTEACDAEHYKVIGNIFDNPELLEVQK